MQTPAQAFSRILEVLDLLEIPYMVVGSVASSVHGMARPTQDIDLAADIRAEQVDDFAAALKTDFYADPEMIRDASVATSLFQPHALRQRLQVRHLPAPKR